MSYQEPSPRSFSGGPARSGSPIGFAAIKYTAIVIIVLAILAFLAWVLIRFLGS